MNHADIGHWLAEKWNLPDKLVSAIAYHHAPGRLERGAELASLIHLADFLCRREKIGDGGGARMPNLDPAALRTFGIHEEPKAAMRRIFGYGELLHEEMERADAFASIARGEDSDSDADPDGKGGTERKAEGEVVGEVRQ